MVHFSNKLKYNLLALCLFPLVVEAMDSNNRTDIDWKKLVQVPSEEMLSDEQILDKAHEGNEKSRHTILWKLYYGWFRANSSSRDNATSIQENMNLSQLIPHANDVSSLNFLEIFAIYFLSPVEGWPKGFVDEIKFRANNEDPAAQNQIGLMYLSGKGMEKNELNAMTWFQKAAAQRFPSSLHNIARIYDKNNDPQAIVWYQKSSEENNAVSEYNLGRIFERGVLDQPIDITKARYWYAKAASKKFPSNGASALYEKIL